MFTTRLPTVLESALLFGRALEHCNQGGLPGRPRINSGAGRPAYGASPAGGRRTVSQTRGPCRGTAERRQPAAGLPGVLRASDAASPVRAALMMKGALRRVAY